MCGWCEPSNKEWMAKIERLETRLRFSSTKLATDTWRTACRRRRGSSRRCARASSTHAAPSSGSTVVPWWQVPLCARIGKEGSEGQQGVGSGDSYGGQAHGAPGRTDPRTDRPGKTVPVRRFLDGAYGFGGLGVAFGLGFWQMGNLGVSSQGLEIERIPLLEIARKMLTMPDCMKMKLKMHLMLNRALTYR